VTLVPAAAEGVFVLVQLTVRPENQQLVIDAVLSEGNPATVPGLYSINLLRSLDGTQVINHMHWASKEAYEQGGELPPVRDTRAAVLRLIEGASTTIFELACPS
jgi:heme-degrading monooxygenase HmoA